MSFRTLCMSRLSGELILSEDPVAQFTDTLIEIANHTIPKSCISKTNSRKYRGLAMFVNKQLKNVRKLNGNFFKTLLQKISVLHLHQKLNLKLSGKQSEKSKGKNLRPL